MGWWAMAPLPCIELRANERGTLLSLARRSIDHGLREGRALNVAQEAQPQVFATSRGVFVTLTQAERLRGCIGSLQASNPLAQSVADAAYGAAFDDPRFARLEARELPGIHIEISILSPMTPMQVSDRGELLESLRPGIDGLLLEDGSRRATFLPKVWEQLASPDAFVDQLLEKAGLPAGHWSQTMCLHRYQAVCVSEP